MAKLTEGMVIARTRASDLENVKKLNCWGSELSDVSLLRKMFNVEVLSLSVNNIGSLGDFQFCKKLQELYIRKNVIKDLTEICYLKDLTKLRNLWLEDNPCATADNYRLTVLRTLPQLQKLDNIAVQPDELQDALMYGLDLMHPEDKKKSHDSLISNTSSSSISPSHHPEVDQNMRRIAEENDNYMKYSETNYQEQRYTANDQIKAHNEQRAQEEQYRLEMERRQKEEEMRRERQLQQQREEDLRRQEEQQQRRRQEEQQRRSQAQNRAGALFGSYEPQSTPVRPTSHQPDYNAMYQSRPYAVEAFPDHHEENANVCIPNDEPLTRSFHSNCTSRSISVDKSSPAPVRPPYSVRPKTRNSNILSAVLCLIKELDYASLEVVEVAVRCRMEELED